MSSLSILPGSSPSPIPKAGLVAQPVGAECVVYDPDADSLHLLDEISTKVWSRLDGRTSIETAADTLAVEFGADPEQVRRDIEALVADLVTKGLLVEQQPRTGTPACRVVTSSMSARLLLESQLRQLDEFAWSVVAGDDDGYRPPPGIESVRLPMRRELAPGDVRAFFRFVRLFRKRRFAVVQTHTPKASMLALPAARIARTPAIYTVHGAMYFRGNGRVRNILGWLFERWCCSWANHVLVQSEEDLETLPQVRICRRSKVHYLGNGIRLDRFTPVSPPPPTEQPVVLMISRLVAEKGCRDFIELARRCAGRARFVHVGPTEPDQSDRLTAEELDAATAWVTFIGAVNDVRPHIAAADLIVLPSYREGIPRAVMEAAATGRPVVAYDIRGVREVVPDQKLLAEVGNLSSLVNAVGRLLDDAHLRERAGRDCQEWVRARFSEDAVVTRVREFYAQHLDIS